MVKEKLWTKEWFSGFTAGAAALFVLEISIAQFVLLSGKPLWLKLLVPFAIVVVGVFKLRRHIHLDLPKKIKSSTAAESNESFAVQGLALQGQGQLDLAFEKLKKAQPVDQRLLDLLYNLALEFERKRDFKKAESVYHYITQHSTSYRDVPQKIIRAKKLSEGMNFGGSMSSTGSSDRPIPHSNPKFEKPMLGRYQVEKELGKGAMGVVYLGRDPKIGRTVAIKTMSLAQEFEPDEIADVKNRFFREAETAGRLSHPNIVQIFDAGEEHDLAYIAMEYVNGVDLSKSSKANNLLEIRDALRYIADAADALDYAHAHGVVHRDIKPANMMMLPDVQIIKLMDFGIARLADSNKTKTGMVLGTPSYMSPEQLSGKKVDGRSDLFSLAVTLYQLLTGSLPFQANSMATLMFKIANEQHGPACSIRSALPPEIDVVLNRALQKNAEARYARGSDMARDLRNILSSLS